MKKKLALTLAAAAGTLSLLVPMASHAATPTLKPACVVVNGPSGFHLQIGYSPTGPNGCKQLP